MAKALRPQVAKLTYFDAEEFFVSSGESQEVAGVLSGTVLPMLKQELQSGQKIRGRPR